MVDRLRTDQEIVVGSHGPETVADRSAGSPHGDSRAARSTRPSGGPPLLSWVPKLGVWAWSFVGFVAATIIVVLALAAVSEIVLPLTFAAVLAVIFKPLVGTLRRHRPATVGRLLRPGSRPRRTDPATTARLRWAT
jgi:hypothetical protein